MILSVCFQAEVNLNGENEAPETPPRLMIAVGVPAFDRKMNNNNGTVRSARLLGVASTDVPVEDINKLSLPYKVIDHKSRNQFSAL